MPNLPGRQSQAARNDVVILDAARQVFLQDPKAPISAVAERAGVGISALYRRYPSKEALLCRLCHDGLRQFVDEAESATAEADGWAGLTKFLRQVVEADVHSLTVHLAGTFTPTAEMREDGKRAARLTEELVEGAHRTGRLRKDVTAMDIGFVLEACAAIRTDDEGRTAQLRHRYLELLVTGMSTHEPPLPGPAPRRGELNRWQYRQQESAEA